MRILVTDVLALLLLTASGSATGQVPEVLHDHKLTAPDAQDHDNFGIAVALLGTTAFVGAPSVNEGAPNAGAVYVLEFESGSWSVVQELLNPDPAFADDFGRSVAVSGDTLVVGAPGDDAAGPDAGAVHVFRRTGTTWAPIAKLTSPTTPVGFQLGFDVAIEGDLCVAGAVNQGVFPSAGGAAYVFREVGPSWVFEAKLVAGIPGDTQFGRSVDVSGARIIVGDQVAPGLGTARGTAYVFTCEGDSWAQEAQLLAPTPQNFEAFGSDVAIDGDTVVVGARFGSAVGGFQAGEAHVFRREAGLWTHEEQLDSTTAATSAQFGASVVLAGDLVVIGAPADTVGEFIGVGSAYAFRYTGQAWVEERRLVMDTDGGEFGLSEAFGSSVAIDGRDALVGAPYEGVVEIDDFRGSASVLQTVTSWERLGHALAGTAGEPLLYGLGLIEGGSAVQLKLEGAISAASAATLIVGLVELNAPFKGGTLVPSPIVLVFALPTPGGQLSLSANWPPAYPPGTTTFFQYWIADPAGPYGFSASNALSGSMHP